MIEDNRNNSGKREPVPDTDALALLIQMAGRRAAPPDDAYCNVLAATRDAWQRKVRRRTYQRAAYAMAAGVAVVAVLAAIATLRAPAPSAPLQVATTDIVVGSASVQHDAQADWMNLGGPDTPLRSGSRVRTDDASAVGLLLDDDVSLRLDAHTEIFFEDARHLELLAGAVYVDTGPGAAAESVIEIITPAGVFRDVGTQFEVRRIGDVTRLRVREGLVTLQRPGGSLDTEAGEEIVLQRDGTTRRASITAWDSGWRWAHAVAPAPYVKDQSLPELLAWVSRETGRAIRFSGPAMEIKAARTTLHGSRQRLLPMEALAVMLATTDFTYSVMADGAILLDADTR